MNITQHRVTLVAFALALFGQSASANTISLTPLTQTANVGRVVEFYLTIDFLEPTVGGSLDILYNSDILSFESIVLDQNFWENVADPAFAVLPDNCFTDGAALGGCQIGDGELNSLGFGSFEGISGEHFVGSVTFVALATGLGTVQTAASDGPFGAFISATDASVMTVVYNGASVLVAIPLPAAMWLMLGGIAVLAAMRRT